MDEQQRLCAIKGQLEQVAAEIAKLSEIVLRLREELERKKKSNTESIPQTTS